MDGQRFDDWTRSLARVAGQDGVATRRRLVRGALGGAAAALLGLGGARRARASHLLPGQACTATEDCSQVGGAVVCANNGIAGDGALNCCREAGGTCTSGAGCCGDLICADNGIAGDGAYNCCRNQGGACTTGAGCCGSLLCVNGVCGGTTSGGARLPGQTCTSTSQCSQSGGATICADNGIASDGALNCCRSGGGVCTSGAGCCGTLVCADNGIAGDGALNCCHNEGRSCTSGAGCCGSLLCINGICQSGSTSGARLPGQSCTSTSQCSQSGGAVVCGDNGYATDGSLNCCRNQGGACTTHAGCCGNLLCTGGSCLPPGSSGGNLAPGQTCTSTSQCSQAGGATVCADNGIAGDGALNCCRNQGGACSTGAGCCGSLLCVNGVCGGTTSGGGSRLPGQSCTSTSQCSQSGGAVVCANNGYASDGALNCCRNAGGACTGNAGCCGALLCSGGTCQPSGSGPVG